MLLATTVETLELETMLVLGLLLDTIHTEDGVIVINMLILQHLHLYRYFSVSVIKKLLDSLWLLDRALRSWWTKRNNYLLW